MLYVQPYHLKRPSRLKHMHPYLLFAYLAVRLAQEGFIDVVNGRRRQSLSYVTYVHSLYK
jgi:hypothetical protein